MEENISEEPTHYYKRELNGEINYCAFWHEVKLPEYKEITKEEYKNSIEKIQKEVAEEEKKELEEIRL